MLFRWPHLLASSPFVALALGCSGPPPDFFSERVDGTGGTANAGGGTTNGAGGTSTSMHASAGVAASGNPTGGNGTPQNPPESAAGEGSQEPSGGPSTGGAPGGGGTDLQGADGGEIETPLTATWPLVNGVQWADSAGNAIQAHGGSVLAVGRYYYWFGERRNSKGTFAAIAAYRSPDLVRWEFVNDVLRDTSDPTLDGAIISEPRVIFNATSGQYVMWMHWENGTDSRQARAATASSATVAGDYAYHGSFRPMAESGVTDHGLPGYMSRDCALFVDDDQVGYFLSTSNDDADLNLYRLTPDYAEIESRVAVLLAGQHRMSPVLFKRNGSYFILGSSGGGDWSPSQAQYTSSESLASGWSAPRNVGDGTAFYSRPSFVLPIQHSGQTSYLYLGDRWAPTWGGAFNDSTYVWQPIVFASDTEMSISASSALLLDAGGGSFSTAPQNFQFVNVKSGAAMEVSGSTLGNGAKIVQNPQTATQNQLWTLNYNGAGYFRISNAQSKRVLEVKGESQSDGASLDLWDDHNGNHQLWLIVDLGDGKFKLKNKLSGKFVTVAGASSENGAALEQRQTAMGEEQQWRFVPAL